jgi:hypothetical protein
MATAKKYNLNGKIYTIPELKKITGRDYSLIRLRLKTGAVSLYDITKTRKEYIKSKSKGKSKGKGKKRANWHTSMMNDELGHWALINKVLRPYDK